MDPVTAGFVMVTEIVKFARMIYEDTPQDIRVRNAERWDRFVDRCESFLLQFQR